ncbi:MAG: GTP 3',8-cyclase MoaA [Pyrobaculum sp.]
MAIDRFGRPFLKIRYVVNDMCNYNCVFCHFEGQVKNLGTNLTAEDYRFVTEVFRSIGVEDFKITGGEPLLRRDIDYIVYNISRVGGRVTLTTNGYWLLEWVEKLRKAGLSRINVSIHTTDPERYRKITSTPPGVFKKVLMGLYESMSKGLGIKLNVVVLKNINTDRESIKDLIRLASSLGATLQFIELMPTGMGADVFNQFYEPIETVAKIITEIGGRPTSLRRDLHNRPIYEVGGVVVELIKNFNNPIFCSGCTTMRLTSDGKLKTCIYAEPAVDLLPYIKNRDVEGLLYLVKTALAMREPRFKFYSSS